MTRSCILTTFIRNNHNPQASYCALEGLHVQCLALKNSVFLVRIEPGLNDESTGVGDWKGRSVWSSARGLVSISPIFRAIHPIDPSALLELFIHTFASRFDAMLASHVLLKAVGFVEAALHTVFLITFVI